MAISGRKPKPAHLKLVSGNPGDRPLQPQRDPSGIEGGPVEKPAGLKSTSVAGRLWDQYIARCHWLTWADSPKAMMWCHLQAEYQKAPTKMIASRIAQLRALGSELGLDVSSRDRMGVTIPTGRPQLQEKAGAEEKPASPASKYFS